MLPKSQRLTEPAEFKAATRRGRRAGGEFMVVHVRAVPRPDDLDTGVPAPGRAGFIVSKAVGNAVVRNRVKRRLRHLVASRLPGLPNCLLVVRALPAAATANSTQLGADLDRCLGRVR